MRPRGWRAAGAPVLRQGPETPGRGLVGSRWQAPVQRDRQRRQSIAQAVNPGIFAKAQTCDDHRMTLHCTTGREASQPRIRPKGAAAARSIRSRLPPRWACCCGEQAFGFQCHAIGNDAGAIGQDAAKADRTGPRCRRPPMNTASGAGWVVRVSAAAPSMQVRRWSSPKFVALARMLVARSGRSSNAKARPPARHHSTEIEPEPAPMSHSNSPARGASADRVSARTGRLVIWPSCANKPSSRPEARGRPFPAVISRATATGAVMSCQRKGFGGGLADALVRTAKALPSRSDRR